MHLRVNCVEVVLKSHKRYTEVYMIVLKVELLQVYFRYTLNILHLKMNVIQRSYNPH